MKIAGMSLLLAPGFAGRARPLMPGMRTSNRITWGRWVDAAACMRTVGQIKTQVVGIKGRNHNEMHALALGKGVEKSTEYTSVLSPNQDRS